MQGSSKINNYKPELHCAIVDDLLELGWEEAQMKMQSEMSIKI